MLKRILLTWLGTFCLAGTAFAVEPVYSNNTPANSAAHENGKTSGGGMMGEIMKAMGAQPEPSGWHAPGELDQAAGQAQGEAELMISACYDELKKGQIGPQISEACKAVVNPSSVGSGYGAKSSLTNETSRYVLYLCREVVNRQLKLPSNPLISHCDTVVASYNKMVAQLARRKDAVAGAPLGKNPTAKDRAATTASQEALKGAYSACEAADRLVSPAQVNVETCEIEQRVTQENACSKTLTTQVEWVCPTGATSGPTRVRAGTVLLAGQYTCQVPEPRNVYTCPTGWTGPSSLPIPPSNQAGQACRNPADNSVVAATLTVQQVLVAHDATPVQTPIWNGNCNDMEVSAPEGWRSAPGVVAPPMAAFNPTGIQRCHLTAGSCTGAANVTQVINDLPVTPACTIYSEKFACMTGETQNTCSTDAKCVDRPPVPGVDDCMEWDKTTAVANTVCLTKKVTRDCTVKEAVMTSDTSCANQKFCPNGQCYDTGYEPDKDFGKAAALAESARQGGRYLTASDMEIFKGFPGRCNSKVMGGLFNCCSKDKVGKLFYKALELGPNLMKPWGDKNGRDTATLDENGKPMLSKTTLDFLNTADNTGALAASVRAVGSMQMTATDTFKKLTNQDYKGAAKELFWTGPRDLAHSIGNSLAAGLEKTLTLFGILKGCDEQDWAVASKTRSNLCVHIGSKVTQTVPITGWTWTRERWHCCFNSMLAMLINTQGRQQFMSPQYQPKPAPSSLAQTPAGPANRIDTSALLDMLPKSKSTPPPAPATLLDYRPLANSLFGDDQSKPTRVEDMYGDVDHPNCHGFSVEQLKVIDFSKIDLRPFIASLETKEKEMMAKHVGPEGNSTQSVIDAATKMYLSNCGGSGQCDGPSPFTPAPPVDASRGDGQDGVPLGMAKPIGTQAYKDAHMNDPATYLSMRPLMFRAFKDGWAYGRINNEDIRLFSKFRFHDADTPLWAEVSIVANVPVSATGSGVPYNPPPTDVDLPGCKLMRIKLTRPAVHRQWTDVNIQDPVTHEWRPPGTKLQEVCENRPAVTDPDTGEVTPSVNTCHKVPVPDPNSNDPPPKPQTLDIEGYDTESMVTFCGDGSVPGAGL